MSAAFLWPMPWMYWSAISTRLLVGIFTPAIRATKFSPVADSLRERLVFCYLGQVSTNANTPFPLDIWGPASSDELSDLDTGLIKGFNSVSSTASIVSSLFRDLFWAFSGLGGA